MKELLLFIRKFLKKILLFPVLFFFNLCYLYLSFLSKLLNREYLKYEYLSLINKFKNNDFKIIKYKSSLIKIFTPSRQAFLRFETFFSKEPDTIEWIEKNYQGGDFIDIGANVGIYSLFFLTLNNVNKVYAFEPSILSQEYLIKNININKFQKRVEVMPNILSNKNSMKYINIGTYEYAGSDLKTEENYSDTGISYKTITNKLDDIEKYFNADFSKVNMIKIDVDGNELEIIKGSKNVLSKPNIKNLLIECNDKNINEISKFLTKLNFKKVNSRKHEFLSQANTIWEKRS